MPFPYLTVPALSVWQSDSHSYRGFRTSDHVLQTIDQLVNTYHDLTMAAARPETLFYLRLGLLHWKKKLNVIPANTPPTNMNATRLPATPKVSGTSARTEAVDALLLIVNETLRAHFGVASDKALDMELKVTYGADNHGVEADQAWFAKYGGNPAITTVYLTDEGIQRQNKLRFRDGIAWRWNGVEDAYSRFDTLDNRESEGGKDQMVHFVMDQRGRIYAGYVRGSDWFKHTSLVGGANGYAGGRMKVQNGIIMLIENDSGHYFPNHQHMRNVLQRLRLYGASVHQIMVKRTSDKALFTSSDMMRAIASWPDGLVGH